MGKPYQDGFDDGFYGNPKKDFGVAAVYLDAMFFGGGRNEERKEYEKGYEDGKKKRKSKR